MKTKEQSRYELMDLIISQIIRKNLTIRSLSMILGNMMSELVNDVDLIAYSGNFEEINTLLDCILDESNANDDDLDELQTYFSELAPNGKLSLGQVEVTELQELEDVMNLPAFSIYEGVKKMISKRKSGGGD